MNFLDSLRVVMPKTNTEKSRDMKQSKYKIHRDAEALAAKYKAKGFPKDRICSLLNDMLPEQFELIHGQVVRVTNSNWTRYDVVRTA